VASMATSDVDRPLLTIAITCYNAEGTIRRALSCALAQTWSQREILVVDDASADGGAQVLLELERVHPEVQVVRHEVNRGFPSALNTLLAEARGTFIAFFDDDDESGPERLLRQYRRIVSYEARHPGAAVLCYSNRTVVLPDARSAEFQRLGIGRHPPEPSGPAVADYVLGLLKDDGRHCWGMFGSCTLMARTETLRRFGGFDSRFRRCAELDLAVRAAFDGAHFISVNAPLVTQYLTPTADKAGDAELRYRLLLVKKYNVYLKQRRAYGGAWCYMHARFYFGRHWQSRLWYLLALLCFPRRVSWGRIKRSSLFDRLQLSSARAASS
jgi:glycosyltransferase involved in cell wall biosynthesis